MLCREALEATAWDVFSSRALATGQARAEVEDLWEKAASTRRRVSLALNPDDETALEKWQSGGSARRATIVVATKGIHSGIEDFLGAVKAARLATGDLVKLAS